MKLNFISMRELQQRYFETVLKACNEDMVLTANTLKISKSSAYRFLDGYLQVIINKQNNKEIARTKNSAEFSKENADKLNKYFRNKDNVQNKNQKVINNDLLALPKGGNNG